jgi:hypothetical protein
MKSGRHNHDMLRRRKCCGAIPAQRRRGIWVKHSRSTAFSHVGSTPIKLSEMLHRRRRGKVPIAVVSMRSNMLAQMALLDHLISAGEQCWGNRDAERVGRFDVDHQFQSSTPRQPLNLLLWGSSGTSMLAAI